MSPAHAVVVAGKEAAGKHLMVCHTSQPPPISSRPANINSAKEMHILPGVQWNLLASCRASGAGPGASSADIDGVPRNAAASF